MKIMEDYIKIIYLSAIVGSVQILSQVVGFKFGADFSYLGFDMQNFSMDIPRIQSWYQEPSFLAVAFLPVIFISLARLFNLTSMISKRKAFFIIFVFILSQSSIGFLGLILCTAIIAINKFPFIKKPVFAFSAFFFLLFLGVFFYSIPSFRVRIDDSSKLFFSDKVSNEDINKVHLSTYALFSNYRIAKMSFLTNPVVGSGLGSYESNYDKFIDEAVPDNNLKVYALNKKDANSMLLRIVSESGLFGLFLLIYFLIRNRIRFDIAKYSSYELDLWIINSSVLVLILIRLLRMGHYTMLGFMVFILIYVYSKKAFTSIDRPIVRRSDLFI